MYVYKNILILVYVYIYIYLCTMIAKILKASSGFSGVMYSEKKINEGKAEFCAAFNFPFSDNNFLTETYINYLEQLSDTNKKVGKNQFHAVISTKGREHDKFFLTDIAQKWMQEMGYANQPFLIYFHNDTENNHVHIISCRIDINGKRINDSLEGRRAGVAIRKLMNENLKEKAKNDIDNILNNYSFSTKEQFKLALERRGWKTQEKNNEINIIKFVKQGNVKVDDVLAKTNEYNNNQQRINQLRAIFYKYKGLPNDEFLKQMREKFGLDIIFHKAKGHTKPYGYTVIDNDKKIIMKGGTIMPLEALLKNLSREEHMALLNQILSDFMSKDIKLYSDFKKILYRSGYNLNKNEISIFGDDSVLLKIPDEFVKKFRYNDRQSIVNEFVVKNKKEAKILSKLFYLKLSDIKINANAIRNEEDIRQIIKTFSNNIEMLNAYFENNDMRAFNFRGDTYVVDMKNSVISNVSDFGLNIGVNFDTVSNNEQYSSAIENNFEVGVFGTLAIMPFLVAYVGLSSGSSGGSGKGEPREDEDELKNKRKKKRKA